MDYIDQQESERQSESQIKDDKYSDRLSSDKGYDASESKLGDLISPESQPDPSHKKPQHARNNTLGDIGSTIEEDHQQSELYLEQA